MGEPETQPGKKRLESWKEIGAYLQRNAVTARRWEKEEGLPVHRHSHRRRSSVYAYSSEIDAWRASRRVTAEPEPAASTWWRSLAVSLTALLCVVMVGNGIHPTIASAQAGQVARQVPTAGFKGDVDSVSQDGRFLIGTDWETGDVAIHDLTTGKSRRVTHYGSPGVDLYSEFSLISPDGRLVAYNWESDITNQTELRVSTLAVLDAAGSQTVYQNPETDYIEPAGWTPDGKRLLVVRILKDQTIQLGMLSIQDRSLRVLKSFGWLYPDVSLSPDGRFIAYAAPDAKGQTKHVAILAADGGREIALEQKNADSRAPVWSPDGSRLVFLSERTGAPSLWTVPVVEGKPGGPAELLRANAGSMSPLGITKNGVLYYTLTNDRRNLYTAELDASVKVVRPPVLVSERFLNSNNRGAWSRDGRYLAYYSFRGPESDYRRQATLVIRAVATGEERDVDMHLHVPIHPFAAPPRWFPDDRSVLVVGFRDEKSGYGYYRVDLASGKADLLHHTTKVGIAGFEPDLSPDGKTMFLSHNDNGPTELIRFDIESRKETKLLAIDHVVSPAVSPNGTQLAFLQHGSIQVMSVTGGEPRVVYRAPGITTDQSTMTWMPDGRSFLFVQSNGFGEKSRHVLWRVPLDGSKPEEVGIRRTGGYPFAAQVHPDGGRIAFPSHEGAGEPEVWALENFLPRK